MIFLIPAPQILFFPCNLSLVYCRAFCVRLPLKVGHKFQLLQNKTDQLLSGVIKTKYEVLCEVLCTLGKCYMNAKYYY